MQENLIKNAVQFLKNPKVAGTDKEKLTTFLKGKGLNDEDIKEAFKRVANEPQPAPVEKLSPTAPKSQVVQILNSTVQQSHQNLSAIPDPRSLTSCKILLLSHNQISAIPSEINILTSLEHLDLSYNTLSSLALPVTFFSLFQLKSLNLSNNNLSSLENFHRLSNLERLNVASNSILEIPEDFVSLQNLSVLIIHNNKLKSIQKSFVLMGSLERVVLVGNPLPEEVIKAAFVSVSSLKALILST